MADSTLSLCHSFTLSLPNCWTPRILPRRGQVWDSTMTPLRLMVIHLTHRRCRTLGRVRGFTALEILTAVAIIALLLGIFLLAMKHILSATGSSASGVQLQSVKNMM